MGFANALFLAGLAAVAVPVIIHMTRSRRYRPVTIGTLRFLESVVRESRRVRKVEGWLLLLVRIGVIALLALLFSRPFLRERTGADGNRKETLVLLDSSGSLAGPGAEVVRDEVRGIGRALPPGSTLTLVEFSDQTRQLDSLDDYRPRPGAPTDYVQAMDWTIDHLQAAGQSSTRVVLISDLQRAAIPAAPPRLWPATSRIEVRAIPAPGEWNACVERVELATPYHGEEIVVEARVRIYGEAGEPPGEATLELESGLTIVSEVPTRRGGIVTFRWRPGDSIEFRGRVTLESNDAWPIDNSRPFLFRLKKQKRLLLIDGDPGATPFLGEAYFLEKAISASGASHGQSAFLAEIRQGLSNREGVLDFSGWDAIACCNVKSFTAQEAEGLAAASARGCGLLFALGGQTGVDGFSSLQAAGLFPTKLGVEAGVAPRLVANWDLAHPTLQRFEAADLQRLFLRDAFVIGPDDNWESLARLENTHPILLARKDGPGPILVFANPLNREWSDLPVNGFFVPLMREWASWLTGLERVGDEIRSTNPGIDEARSPGVYKAEDGRIDVVAAQPLEMDPSTVGVDVFRTALAIPEPVPELVPDPPGVPKDRERPNEWWPWIVVALLVLLVTESYMSDRGKNTVIEPKTPHPDEA